MTLPTNQPISVAAGIVRWARDEEFGVETLVMDEKTQVRLGTYIRARMKGL
jgi:hypothetical protein